MTRWGQILASLSDEIRAHLLESGAERLREEAHFDIVSHEIKLDEARKREQRAFELRERVVQRESK